MKCNLAEVHMYKLCKDLSFCISIFQIDDREAIKFGESQINPWSTSSIEDLLKKLNPHIMKYDVRQYS